MALEEYRKKIANLSVEEKKLRDLYLRDLSLGKIQGPPTGYASIDKPWLKYYREEHIKAAIPHMTAYEYLKECNKDNMDLPAIDSMEGAYTYRELFDIIDNTAQSLYAMGIENGKKVMMMLPPISFESILFYGVDKVGAAISEVPIQTTVDDLVNKINKLDMSMLFISDFLLSEEAEKEIYEKTNIENIVIIGNKEYKDERTISWNQFIENGKDKVLPNIKRNPEDLLFIASTGGSTGEPKSVMLNDECFNIAVHQYLNSDLSYDSGDRWLRLWSLFSASAVVANNHLPLCAGMYSVIRPFPMDINDFDKIVYESKTDHLMLIPQLLDVLEKSDLLKDEDLSYIKTVGCGGLAITNSFEERVNEFFKAHGIDTFLGYGWGCTESFTLGTIRSNFDNADIGCVGAPHVDTIVSIFNPETGKECKYGEEGEICVRSFPLMLGYYDDVAMTDNVLKVHTDGTKWLHTGDLGIMHENGLLSVKGRMTRTIFVYPTAKVYPNAMENVISKIPGVGDVLVGEIEDKEHEGFGIPICFVIPEKSANLNYMEDTINIVCEKVFADYARPEEIYFMDEFPVTKVGKKDVRALEESVKNNEILSKVKKLK